MILYFVCVCGFSVQIVHALHTLPGTRGAQNRLSLPVVVVQRRGPLPGPHESARGRDGVGGGASGGRLTYCYCKYRHRQSVCACVCVVFVFVSSHY